METAQHDALFAAHNQTQPHIGLVRTEEQRAQVRKFWYAIYVEELNRKQHHADHSSQSIKDPLEASGHILAAWNGDVVVGTVRINFTRDQGVAKYLELYCCDQDQGFDVEDSSVVTRFMVNPEYRSTKLGLRLLSALYEYGIAMSATTCYMDCNAHLVSFFECIGFRYCRKVVHPEYDEVSVMRLDVYDREHLEGCKSPFISILDRVSSTT
jgi:predicted GNAT family N-acyltransferase